MSSSTSETTRTNSTTFSTRLQILKNQRPKNSSKSSKMKSQDFKKSSRMKGNMILPINGHADHRIAPPNGSPLARSIFRRRSHSHRSTGSALSHNRGPKVINSPQSARQSPQQVPQCRAVAPQREAHHFDFERQRPFR